MVETALRRVVVDTHAHLPDMFEITFLDEGGVLANNMIDIGTSIKIQGGAADSVDAPTLITGEVTSIECDIQGAVTYTTIRGYDKSHRMQRVQRTYVYRNQKDSDIAKLIMAKYMLMPTTGPPMIDETTGVHDALAQFNQTDWEFLSCRAAENGFDFGVLQGGLYFRKPPKAGTAGSSGSPCRPRRAADAQGRRGPLSVPARGHRRRPGARRDGPRLGPRPEEGDRRQGEAATTQVKADYDATPGRHVHQVLPAAAHPRHRRSRC